MTCRCGQLKEFVEMSYPIETMQSSAAEEGGGSLSCLHTEIADDQAGPSPGHSHEDPW